MSEDKHSDMLAKVISAQKSILLRPETNGHDNGAPMILLAPLKNPNYEVIELIVPRNEKAGSDNELMSTLQHTAGIASSPHETSDLSNSCLKKISVDSFSQYIHGVHKSLDKKATCANIANEPRLLLDCDRVTVVSKNRGAFRVVSISGQPSVNRRSNTVRLLEKLAKLVLKTEREFWCPAEDEVPPPLESVLDEYLAISVTRSLVIKPIFEKPEAIVEDPESNERHQNRVIGALIFEQSNEQLDVTATNATLVFVNQHAGNALRNATRHNDLFLYPLWNLLSKSRILTAPRVLPKTLLALAAIAMVTLFLALAVLCFRRRYPGAVGSSLGIRWPGRRH